MKRVLVSLIILLATSLTVSAADFQKADPRNMKFPALNFEIPKSERVVLDCGMPVYLLRDTELPIINLSATIRTGSVYEPAAKSGLASLTGTVIRSGGAAGIAPEAIDDELEFMASAVESSIASDSATVSLTSLSKNFSRSLKLFSDILLRPDFSEKRVDIARKHLIEGLRRQNDDPKEIGGREINSAIYAGHPLGAVPTLETAAVITRQDMLDFHSRFYRADNIILTVAGDFDRTAMLRELNTIFTKPVGLPPFALPEIPQPPLKFASEVIYGKKDVNQTVIRLGHLGVTKDNPDLYALRVLDYILGGSFTSRLTMEIRTNQGLAYHVGSRFDIGRRYTGTFIAETETKAESTIKAITLLKDIITGMTTAPVTDQELQAARDYIINSFMFGFTSPASIVTQQARLEYYGYDRNYLDNYRSNISKVTKEDVLAAAKKHLHPESFKLVVIGDTAKFEAPLSKFGEIRELDLRLKTDTGK